MTHQGSCEDFFCRSRENLKSVGIAMIAYVTTQGAHIVREGERLIVQSENARNILFSSKLEQLILFGNVSISAPARHLLLRKNIDTVFIQKDGRYMGRLFTRHPGNALLRKRQFLMQDDIPFRLAVAKDIITGKILNQATLMARIRRARRQPAAGETARELQRYAAMIPGAESLDVLRGMEGRAAAAYFRTFSCGFSQDWGFSRRLRRPAPDPVNAVLSLLYTLLARLKAAIDPDEDGIKIFRMCENCIPLRRFAGRRADFDSYASCRIL